MVKKQIELLFFSGLILLSFFLSLFFIIEPLSKMYILFCITLFLLILLILEIFSLLTGKRISQIRNIILYIYLILIWVKFAVGYVGFGL